MQKIRSYFLFLFLITGSAGFAQKKELITNYINTYKDLAISEMQRTGVPAAITLAQGIHESGAGNSKLVLESNNHFGIKCKSNWTGESVKHDDDAKGECFRKYPLAEQSYKDHSDFLKNGQRYAFLFALEPTDYKAWAKGLKQAGYATNPKYPEVLIKLIEDYNLQDYTFMALGKASATDESIAIKPVEDNSGQPIVTAAVVTTTEKPTVQTAPVNYPAGEFKIYDTKVVYAKKGVSFLAIAKQYGVDLSRLFEFNDMSPAETLDKDQLIYLQRKRKTGLHDFHIVAAGETLRDIAQLEAIRLESIAELNWIKQTDRPAIGEKLSLKEKSRIVPKLALNENYSLVPALNTKKN